MTAIVGNAFVQLRGNGVKGEVYKLLGVIEMEMRAVISDLSPCKFLGR